jgi:hypothetical protein
MVDGIPAAGETVTLYLVKQRKIHFSINRLYVQQSITPDSNVNGSLARENLQKFPTRSRQR